MEHQDVPSKLPELKITADFPKKKEGNQPFFKTAFGSAFKYALSFADSFV